MLRQLLSGNQDFILLNHSQIFNKHHSSSLSFIQLKWCIEISSTQKWASVFLVMHSGTVYNVIHVFVRLICGGSHCEDLCCQGCSNFTSWATSQDLCQDQGHEGDREIGCQVTFLITWECQEVMNLVCFSKQIGVRANESWLSGEALGHKAKQV